MDKFLDFLLWGLIAFTLILFVALIIVGDATYFRFLSTAVDPEILTAQVKPLGNTLF